MSIKSIKLPNPNAVLYKDMQVKVKRSKLTLSVFLLNLLLTITAVIVMIVMSVEAASFNTINYSTFKTMFIVIACIEYGITALITPAITAGSITMEREKQTFDVLLTTKLTPWQIVIGKYWSSILEILLLIVSGLPVFSLVFIYGGMSFFGALGTIAIMLCNAMVIAAFGIYSSAITKKSITATVTAYIWVMALYFASISAAAGIKGIVSALDEAFYYYHGYYSGIDGDPAMFILYINPLTTFYDAISYIFGVDLMDLTDATGMAGLLSDITDYKATNILLRFWTPISLIIQGLISFLALKGASRHIDPLRTKNKKGKKLKHAKSRKATAA